MKLYYWNENCSRAGQLVASDDVANYETGEESADNHGDWSHTEGTPAELLAEAESMETSNPSLYRVRLASVIRERVYFEHPELEPVEYEQ